MVGPEQVIFHINAACNSACRICRWHKRRLAGTLPLTELRPSDVRGVLAQYPSANRVTLSSLGEPLLHSTFGAILHETALRRHDCDIHLVTNGALLHKHLQILDTPGCINVSVDTADAALHAVMRPGVPLADVVRNLRLAGGLPKHPRRRIGIVMVVTKQTGTSVLGVAALAAEAGLNFFAVTRGIGLELSLASPNEEVSSADASVTSQIASARSLYPALDVQDFFSNVTGNLPGAPYPHCMAPWTSLQVFNDGHVRLCCRAYSVDLGHWSRGDQWEGKTLTRLRQQLQARAVDPVEFKDCATCPMR